MLSLTLTMKYFNVHIKNCKIIHVFDSCTLKKNIIFSKCSLKNNQGEILETKVITRVTDIPKAMSMLYWAAHPFVNLCMLSTRQEIEEK